MPRYTYIAKSTPQKIVQGDIEAESEQDAINKLTHQGYFPVSIKPEEFSFSKHSDQGYFRKVPNKDIVLAFRQLTSLIESGVNILNSLNIIANQTPNKYLKGVLIDIINRIKDGSSFSYGLSVHPYLFPHLYTAMVCSGEVGGNLGQVLKNLADFLEREEELKNSVRAAMTYPIFVFSVGVMTIIILLVFVIPRLITMFQDMGQALPLPTQILVNLSGFINGYWWMILAVIFVFIFLSKRILQRPYARLWLDGMSLKIPVWGEVNSKTDIGRLMRTLSMLLASGIPVISALDTASSVLENRILKAESQKFQNQISEGLSLSACLKESKFFPPLVTNIISVGEESGTLEKSLLRIAEDYEGQVERALKALTRLLEPVIILVMGLVVGFIVLSMLLPIFQIDIVAG